MSTPAIRDSSDAEIRNLLVAARVRLLMRYPFYGTIALGLELVDATDRIPTAAVDGVRLYYNRHFFASLTFQAVLFVFAHEILHCVYEHLVRRGSRDPKYWNMAADYAVNDILVLDKCGEMPTRLVVRNGTKKETRIGLHNTKYRGWPTEKIYDDLFDNNAKPQAGLDDHLEIEKVEKEDGTTGSRLRLPGGGEIEIPESPEELGEIIREAVLEAAAAAAGNLPAGMDRIINGLLTPKLDWRDLLNTHLQSTRKAEYRFTKPARKTLPYGITLPSLIRDERLDAAVAIDCSGSIDDQTLTVFFSELRGIIETFPDYQIRIFCFDTQVYNTIVITPENLDDLDSYKAKGRGGTNFGVIFEHLATLVDLPDRLVVLTDGLCGNWGDPNLVETLWVIYGQRHVEPPFGQFVHYDPV